MVAGHHLAVRTELGCWREAFEARQKCNKADTASVTAILAKGCAGERSMSARGMYEVPVSSQ